MMITEMFLTKERIIFLNLIESSLIYVWTDKFRDCA